MRTRSRTTSIFSTLSLAVAAAMLVTSCSSATEDSDSGSVADGELVGLFKFDPGNSDGDQISGTWFKMVVSGGDKDNGPFVNNASSPVDNGETTLLSPGKCGGLVTGSYQSQNTPAYNDGNSTSDSIVFPTKFFNVAFSISTNAVDLQTQAKVAPPTVRLNGDFLTADLSSWAASWNSQEFNQGAPKPIPDTGAEAAGGESAKKAWDWVQQKWLDQPPADTTEGPQATGTFDRETRRFTLNWSSHIEGGPFNNFLGIWHLEGVFEPSESGSDGEASGQQADAPPAIAHTCEE